MQRRQSTGQLAYAELKRLVMAGALGWGRLDIQRLADRMRMSPTPVREALARLAAEHLVEFDSGHGYSTLALTSAMLSDLYVWSAQLIQLALTRAATPFTQTEGGPSRPWRGLPVDTDSAYAHAISWLFFDIATAQPNQELAERVSEANDRLFLPRLVEPLIWPSTASEANTMRALWRACDLDLLREKLDDHAAHRIACCHRLARELKLRADLATPA